jgi:hypothetical protein
MVTEISGLLKVEEMTRMKYIKCPGCNDFLQEITSGSAIRPSALKHLHDVRS